MSGRRGSRSGSGCASARPGAPETGFRQRFALRAVARLVRAIAQESGTSRLAVRVGRPPTSTSSWWPSRGRTASEPQVMGRRGGRGCSTRCGGRRARGRGDQAVGRASGGRERAGAAPHTLTPKVPVVAVTGTNGKTTTSRMIAHIARTAGLLVGWSNTDGIYIDGELVEAGDYSGPSGAGRVLRAPGGAARGHRDRPRRDPAEGDRRGPQRRLRGHQRLRRPPGAAGHRHRRPARRGQGGGAPDHPKRGWAVLNADDPRVFAMRGGDQGAALGVRPRPRLAGDPRGRSTTAAGRPR